MAIDGYYWKKASLDWKIGFVMGLAATGSEITDWADIMGIRAMAFVHQKRSTHSHQDNFEESLKEGQELRKFTKKYIERFAEERGLELSFLTLDAIIQTINDL